MKPTKRSLCTLSILAVAFLGLIGLGATMTGEPASKKITGKPTPEKHHVGFVEDWSSRHLVFSNPGTYEQVKDNPEAYARWLAIQYNTRYIMQQAKRSGRGLSVPEAAATNVPPVEEIVESELRSEEPEATQLPTGHKPKRDDSKVSEDWGMGLDGAQAVGTVTIPNTPGATNITLSGSGITYLTIAGTEFEVGQGTDETGTIQMGSSAPGSGTAMGIGGITYDFTTTTPISTTQSNYTCTVVTSATAHQAPWDNLIGAMGGSGSSSGTGTWECNSDVGTGSTLTVTASTDPTSCSPSCTISLQAKTAGSTGFGTPSFGSTDITWVTGSPVAGANSVTNGAASPPTFGVLDQNDNYVTAAVLATNVQTAISENSAMEGFGGVIATVSGSTITLAARDTTSTAFTLTTGGTTTPFDVTAPSGGVSASGSPAVQPNSFPAVYGASLTSASCSDYIVYPTGSQGSGTAATIAAYTNLYAACSSTNPAVPSLKWAYNTNGGSTPYAVSTSPIISLDGTQVAFIQSTGSAAQLVLLKGAQTPATLTTTGTPLNGSQAVTNVTNATAADIGLQITDTTNTGCIPAHDTITNVSGTPPTLTLATAANSSGGCATGDALTITAENTGTPGAPVLESSWTAYQSCTGACMFTLPLNNGSNVNATYSSPFYDFAADFALYVGDDAGYLEKIINVFTTPNNTTAPTVSSYVKLNSSSSTPVTSPVFDSTSGCVFVGDTAGYLYKVSSGISGNVCTTSFGTVTESAQLGGGTNKGIIDAPLVDPTNQGVYAFVTDNSAGYNAVYRLPTGFLGTCTPATNNCGQSVQFGTTANGAASKYLYAGSFDNVFYENTTPRGNLWEVANTNLTTGAGLYYVPVTYSNHSVTVNSGSATITIGSNQSSYVGGSIYDEYSCIPIGDYVTSATTSSPPYTVTLAADTTCAHTGDSVTITGIGAATSAATFTGSGTGYYPWPSPVTEFCNTNGASACTATTTTTTVGTDHLFFSVNAPLATISSSSTGCTAGAGNGCVFSVSVNSTSSVTVSGANLPLKTPTGSTVSGCWATGGLVVDNSDTTTAGASNIYFIGLNAATAGNPFASGATSSACNTSSAGIPIIATQASQSAP